MKAQKIVADFNSSDEASQKKMLAGMSEAAIDFEMNGNEADALLIHTCIARADFGGDEDDDVFNEDNEAALLEELKDLDPNKDLSGTLIGSMLEGMMDDTADIINMSREYCEDAGITCPSSYAKKHTEDYLSRPEKDRVPANIIALLKLLELEDEIMDLYPRKHPDNNWDYVLNVATDHGDVNVYMDIYRFVESNQLCDKDELEDYPSTREAFANAQSMQEKGQELLKLYLESQNPYAETSFRGLIEKAKKVSATAVMLNDHPGYGLHLGVGSHNGQGEFEGPVKLVDDYDAWFDEQLETIDEDDDEACEELEESICLDQSMTWEWMRQRWLKVGGPQSGVSVILFNNGVGDTMDLSTGEEPDEDMIEDLL